MFFLLVTQTSRLCLTRVGSSPVGDGLFAVLHEVLDVAHLMVDDHQILMVDFCTHLYPEEEDSIRYLLCF